MMEKNKYSFLELLKTEVMKKGRRKVYTNTSSFSDLVQSGVFLTSPLCEPPQSSTQDEELKLTFTGMLNKLATLGVVENDQVVYIQKDEPVVDETLGDADLRQSKQNENTEEALEDAKLEEDIADEETPSETLEEVKTYVTMENAVAMDASEEDKFAVYAESAVRTSQDEYMDLNVEDEDETIDILEEEHVEDETLGDADLCQSKQNENTEEVEDDNPEEDIAVNKTQVEVAKETLNETLEEVKTYVTTENAVAMDTSEESVVRTSEEGYLDVGVENAVVMMDKLDEDTFAQEAKIAVGLDQLEESGKVVAEGNLNGKADDIVPHANERESVGENLAVNVARQDEIAVSGGSGRVRSAKRKFPPCVRNSDEDFNIAMRILTKELAKEQPDLAIVADGMAKTYESERKPVYASPRVTVADMQKFGGLRYYTMIKQEYCLILEDMKKMERLENRLNGIFVAALQHADKSVLRLTKKDEFQWWRRALERRKGKNDDSESKKLFGIVAVCVKLTGLHGFDILCKKKTTPLMESEVSQLTYPTIISTEEDIFGGGDCGNQFLIYADRTELFSAPNIYEAILSLYATYYVLNCVYPMKLKSLFSYFDKLSGETPSTSNRPPAKAASGSKKRCKRKKR